jgi:ATP-dependent DNA helicase RecQ
MAEGAAPERSSQVRDAARVGYGARAESADLRPSDFTPRCLCIDLEVGRKDSKIHKLAGIRPDTGQTFHFRGGDLAAALKRLDALAEGADLLVGHNVIDFDAKHLAAANPDLRLLGLPKIDTLRLSPLAFPRNPYHHLLKHYQDGGLKHASRNDPELDARQTLTLLTDEYEAFRATHQQDPDLVAAYHWLTTVDDSSAGADWFFGQARGNTRPSDAAASVALRRLLQGKACCRVHVGSILNSHSENAWDVAYALAWLSVSGGNSVMPPWVRHQFPGAGLLVKKLRDTCCTEPTCEWCREHHDARKELMRWFPTLAGFRPEPKTADGRSLQECIVESAMRGEHALGILPTGTGKSVCYQIPALSRYEKTGALTVVISPLVALMADQVAGLESRGITCCAAVNGLLSMPERADVLDRIRLGDVAILIIAPEQLRSRSLRKVLAQREIGAWVMDEAHCLSKWGHDFRPDYRYVARFIKESAGKSPVPPVLCLTATAKPDVVLDIQTYFRERLGIEMKLFDGGSKRENLDFLVVETSPAEKFAHVHQILEADLPPKVPGGAIIYCATRSQTEQIAAFLIDKGVPAAYFHSKLPPETKKDVQARFIRGDLRVIAATNAFGMGIDKPDVRLVIHADIPGSLENYLQEAGRAGRDQRAARCILLYTPEDVERQFGMSARSRLNQREIQAILRSLRRLEHRKRGQDEVVATAGEILLEEDEGAFRRDSATDDTRVRTAVSWLEEAELLQRDENLVQVFPSSLRVASLNEAREKVEQAAVVEPVRGQLLKIVDVLINADADEGVTTDELMAATGLSPDGVRLALDQLEKLGIASNDTVLTAYVHSGVERSSLKRLEEAGSLEAALIKLLREVAPDMGRGDETALHLRHVSQRLKDEGHRNALPHVIRRLLESLSKDGVDEQGGVGSIRLRRWNDPDTIQFWLQREWDALELWSQKRREGAQRLMEHLLGSLPTAARGTDLLAETTLGKLQEAIASDLLLKSTVKNPAKLRDRALLWLHEQEVIRLNKGLAVFRPAMTIRLGKDKRMFVKADFAPLQQHYDEQVTQIHVMAEYAHRGLTRMADALLLTMDYFRSDRETFLKKWLADREKELGQQTTPESWRRIVDALKNPIQQRIVADDREQTNVLILAGPGSGKTRVLVHRIAYLVRARRENPRSIIALAYNRHAALEIRRRLAALIGDDANGVTVLTCHALAMRLCGASFADRTTQANEATFDELLRQAVLLLNGEGLPPEEADEQRDRLLAGFRWILVDEYQDIGPGQYELISALAGRTRTDGDGRLSLMAVGDDDQNIYAFSGASVEFIRRFEADYSARPAYLTENYRSAVHIIDAANALIAPARDRMKSDRPITVDRGRAHLPKGGRWEKLDPVGRGRVSILEAAGGSVGQACAAIDELRRLEALDTEWNWSETAVVAREWRYLEPVRAYCEHLGIPSQRGDEDTPSFWWLRETQALVAWVREPEQKLLDGATLTRWLAERPPGPWWDLLREAAAQYAADTSGAELPAPHFVEWLAEWGREFRRRQTGVLLLSAHRAKGLEFRHVVVLDGAWDRVGRGEDRDATRRLYYVAMTRARETLTLLRNGVPNPLLTGLADLNAVVVRSAPQPVAVGPNLKRRFERLTLAQVDLGFAGRYAADRPVHRAISGLEPGDHVNLVVAGDRVELWDLAGRPVGRLAKKHQLMVGYRVVEARVSAIVARRKDENSEFAEMARTDRWEVVVPELVYEPE